MGDGAKRIDIKVKDGDKEVGVQVEIDEGTAKGNIKVGRDKTGLTALKKGKDGKRVEGKTKNILVGELSVVITVDCDKDPAEIRIVATDKKGTVRKDSTYTLTHAEQDRLVEFLKGTAIPELALAEPPGAGTVIAETPSGGASSQGVPTSAAVLVLSLVAVAVVGLYIAGTAGPGPAASPTPTAAATPTATPTPTPVATPVATVPPGGLTLTAAPRVVSLGATSATVKFSGTGFTPGGAVTKTFVRPDGSRFSFETTADARGHLAAELTLTPDQPVGSWTAIARDEATGREAEATFEVRH